MGNKRPLNAKEALRYQVAPKEWVRATIRFDGFRQGVGFQGRRLHGTPFCVTARESALPGCAAFQQSACPSRLAFWS